jgi:hypothetical protein
MVNTRDVWLVSIMICLDCAKRALVNKDSTNVNAYLVDIIIDLLKVKNNRSRAKKRQKREDEVAV